MRFGEIAWAFGGVGPLAGLASFWISASLLRRRWSTWKWACGCLAAYRLLLLAAVFVGRSRLAAGPCMFGCLLGGGLARNAALRRPIRGETSDAPNPVVPRAPGGGSLDEEATP